MKKEELPEIKIRRCPFCGSEGVVKKLGCMHCGRDPHCEEPPEFYVECSNEFKCLGTSRYDKNKEQAIDKWNTRVVNCD